MNKILLSFFIMSLPGCKEIIRDVELTSEVIQDVELAEVKIEKDIEQSEQGQVLEMHPCDDSLEEQVQ